MPLVVSGDQETVVHLTRCSFARDAQTISIPFVFFTITATTTTATATTTITMTIPTLAATLPVTNDKKKMNATEERDVLDVPLLPQPQQQRKPLTFWTLQQLHDDGDLLIQTSWTDLAHFMVAIVAYELGCIGITQMVAMFFRITNYIYLLWLFVSIGFVFPVVHSFYRRRKFHQLGPVQYLEYSLKNDLNCFYNRGGAMHANNLYLLAKVHVYLENLESAEQTCRRLVEEVPRVSSESSGSRLFAYHGRILMTLGRCEEALPAYQESLRLLRLPQKPNLIKVVNAMKNIALIHLRLGQADVALEVLDEAATMLTDAKLEQSIELSKVLAIRAKCYRAQAKLEDALAAYEKAKDIYLFNVGHFPRVPVLARLYRDLGDAQREMGNVETARSSYQVALEIFRRSGFADEHVSIQSLLRRLEESVV